MLDWIQAIMQKGYVDEHNHKLYGASAISHFGKRPISSLSQHEIEAGKKFVQKYLNK